MSKSKLLNKPNRLSILGRFGFHIAFILIIANVAMVIAIRLYILAQLPCMTVQEVQSDSRCLYILNDKVYEKGSRTNPHHNHDCASDVTAAIATQPFHIAEAAKYLDPNLKGQICAANPTPTPTPTPTPNPTPSATPNPTPSPVLNPTPSAQLNPTQTPIPTTNSNTYQPTPTPGIGGPVNPTRSPTPVPSPSTSKTSQKTTPQPTSLIAADASALLLNSPGSNFITQTPVISPDPNPVMSPSSSPDTTIDWTEPAIFWTQAAVYIVLSLLAFTVTIGTGMYFQDKKYKHPKNS